MSGSKGSLWSQNQEACWSYHICTQGTGSRARLYTLRTPPLPKWSMSSGKAPPPPEGSTTFPNSSSSWAPGSQTHESPGKVSCLNFNKRPWQEFLRLGRVMSFAPGAEVFGFQLAYLRAAEGPQFIVFSSCSLGSETLSTDDRSSRVSNQDTFSTPFGHRPRVVPWPSTSIIIGNIHHPLGSPWVGRTHLCKLGT